MSTKLGQIVTTKGIQALAHENVKFREFCAFSLCRYTCEDWGDTCASDWKMNDEALKKGDERIVAKYNNEIGDIFIITEWDRSVTTILFCDEY